MASGSFNLTRTGSTSSYITFKCAWSSTSNGAAANSSTVKVTVTASKSSSSTANTYGTQETTATVGGVSQKASGSFTLAPSKTITLLSKSYTVKHNADGTKKVTISVNVGGNVIYANGSATVTLDTIPQYATVSQSLTSRTETTAVMAWTSDSTIDYIYYSTNNGSTWTGINVADGKSGSYTISGLSPNTTYQIKTRVRRKDSQLTTDSTALSVTTYAYPYANSMPNFTVGDKLTIGLYNPLKRSVTVNIIGADNSQISNDTTTGTSITGYNGTVVVNRLLASLPNGKSGTYKVKVTYGLNVTTKTGGTYQIPNTYAPTIGAVSYQDTKSSVVAITGNNQLIVRNQSIVQFTATGLTALEGAAIANCSVNVNGNNYSLTVNGSTATGGNITIDSASDISVIFTVTDSRGNSSTKELNVTVLDWILPTAIITAQRQSNYYSETDINVNADYASVDGKNAVTIQCRYKKTTDTSYSSYITLQDEVTSTITLDNMFEWDIQVQVADKFGSTTYNLTIPLGMPIIYFDRLKNSVGINCFPQDQKSLEVNGNSVIKSVMTAYLDTALTNLAVSTYTKIPLNQSISTGDKLTLTQDGGIQIGAGVSFVKVSGIVGYNAVNADGAKHVRIMKNSYTNNNTLAWAYDYMVAGDPQSVAIPPMLAPVTEGDVIYLWYHTTNGTDTIGGNAYGNRTSLTVETI